MNTDNSYYLRSHCYDKTWFYSTGITSYHSSNWKEYQWATFTEYQYHRFGSVDQSLTLDWFCEDYEKSYWQQEVPEVTQEFHEITDTSLHGKIIVGMVDLPPNNNIFSILCGYWYYFFICSAGLQNNRWSRKGWSKVNESGAHCKFLVPLGDIL